MRLASTYEFVEAGQPRWVVAYSRKAACNHAAACGWSGRGRRRYGPFWTGLLLTAADADAVLDRTGVLIAPLTSGVVQ